MTAVSGKCSLNDLILKRTMLQERLKLATEQNERAAREDANAGRRALFGLGGAALFGLIGAGVGGAFAGRGGAELLGSVGVMMGGAWSAVVGATLPGARSDAEKALSAQLGDVDTSIRDCAENPANL